MSGPPDIVTFGCRLNAFESEVIRDRAAGLDDTIIFNTCAVTKEAERQARQAIRKARRQRPGSKIIVTGCAAQVNANTFARMPEVDRVIGNTEKLTEAAYHSETQILVGDIMTVQETAGHLVEGFEGRARAFVQVQQGCDHRCTFCIIPYGRGNSRSAPIGEITNQVRTLAENGYSEIVLTGVDITSYGADLPGRPSLGQMMRRLLAQVPELPRLRLSSIDCVEIDDDLMRLIETEPRLMPHFHLSLQAGDDMTLKRMKRRHGRDDAIAICNTIRARRPDVVFGADLIAGFPTETEAMFQRSLDLIDECGLTWLHVFPYSTRPGTPAALMPQVPGDIRRKRAARLRQAGEAAATRFLDSLVGATVAVLIEQNSTGRTEHFAPVRSDVELHDGSLATLRIVGREGDALRGELTT
ncbi:MAG: tRNA (N(6)-L-threonylcarbamoyladenosine(37)-C(2))-methylthiotransferase MtaB [Pseudomonadota bacterium]|nr:tRNA (N(6)-L-threonylcarbamoyladenosine(37)-C(2))-methylthiotransferase MtaB [Pseudomonadota bacterium]